MLSIPSFYFAAFTSVAIEELRIMALARQHKHGQKALYFLAIAVQD